MAFRILLTFFSVVSFVEFAQCQYPPKPKYDKVILSKVFPDTKLSYKATNICETTKGVKAWSGYVSIPANGLADLATPNDYSINLFFWFFEARKDPKNAALSLFLGGGPGTSSLKGLFHGNGPCYVNPDSKTTRLNPHSWNNEVNMLYIDQPVQTGFSYDTLVNLTMTLMGGDDSAGPIQEQGTATDTKFPGVGASHNAFQTSRTSTEAASAVWRFLQVLVGEFPEHNLKGKKLSIWSNGYAGRFAPSFAAYFMKQSQKPDKSDVSIKIGTIGIVNGQVDMATQQIKLPLYAYNNTYGIEAIDAGTYTGVTRMYSKENGCGPSLKFCRDRWALYEKEGGGTNTTAGANAFNSCDHAATVCMTVGGAYSMWSERDIDDIGRRTPVSFPPRHYIGYLNSREVQQALGVPRNFTETNAQVGYAMDVDSVLGGSLEDIGSLLDQGVTVALVYGDRDYFHNWLGGEAVSTAVPWKDAAAFKKAGYSAVKFNSTYAGGMVRQLNRLSFSRVFDAGNEAYADQPELLSQIFKRAMSSKDIASGSAAATTSAYRTTGPSSTWARKNNEPCPMKNECYIWAPETCSATQRSAIGDGWAIIKDYVVVGLKEGAPSWADWTKTKSPPVPKGCAA